MDSQSRHVVEKSHLLTIPLELILHIVSYLTTPEYGSLRATCRHVEASLLKSFAKEFFTKRQFMITEFSLQALVDISKSRFASSLTHLIIGLDRPFETQYVSGIDFERALWKCRGDEEYHSHRNLLKTCQDVEYLTEALHNLPNLETVGLRDFNSRGRYRDGGSWNSYGAPTLTSNGVTVASVGVSPRNVNHAFLSILRALGKTKSRGLHSVTRLEVILRHSSLSDEAFSIPRHLETDISPVLVELETLFLTLNSKTYPILVGDETDFKAFSGFFLAQFLLGAKSLKHLRLNFTQFAREDAEDILKWLSGAPGPGRNSQTPAPTAAQGMDTVMERKLQEYPSPPHFPNLEQLDIGMLTIDRWLLLRIIERYKTSLRRISLHKVTLVILPQEIRDKVNVWHQLFSQMDKLHLNLSAINLSCLAQYARFLAADGFSRSRLRQIVFKGGQNRGGMESRTWSGSDIPMSSRISSTLRP
ncbi:hypothetical protein F5B20DRAFT_554499 [Whalleya microplaca]|nr:hypothetical protein F5B20DRAFT_554499 [Whalleya microplaca]